MFYQGVKKTSVFIILVCIIWANKIFSASNGDIGELIIRPETKAIKQFAQKEKRKFILNFSGDLALESFYDSRQILGKYQDEFVITPLPFFKDERCLDINDKDQFNMLGIRAYTRLHVLGPEVWGALTSAKLEAKFTGVNNESVRLLRLNKAYVQFDWERTKLLLGHDYHPIGRYTFMTGDKFYPFTLSSAWGAGFDPFRYVAQARLAHKYKNSEILLALTKFYNSENARRVTRPDIFLQVSTVIKDRNVFAIGLSNNVEVPRLETLQGFKTTQQISSIVAFISSLIRVDPFKIESRFIYAENGELFDLIGGFAVSCYNPDNDERTYVPLRAVNFWTDITYEGLLRAEPGLYIGVTKNIGASRSIIKSAVMSDEEKVNLIEGDLSKINNMFVISPRIRMRWGPMMVGAEIEFLRVAFARRSDFEDGWEEDFANNGEVIHTRPVSNTRFLVSTRYYF